MYVIDCQQFVPTAKSEPMTLFDRITALFPQKSPDSQKRRKSSRTCRFEELEGREMLSATPWTLVDDAFGDSLQEPQVERCSAELASNPEVSLRYTSGSLNALAPLAAAPMNFLSTAQTQDTITLTWDEQSGLTGYTLQYRADTDTEWETWTPAPDADATSALITGLESSTAYFFRLTAINDDGSAIAETSVSTTAPPIPQPDPPGSFKSTAQSFNSITLTWDTQSNLIGYTLEYKAATDTDWQIWTPAPNIGATSARVTGLEPETAYNFRLTATNPSGTAAATANASTSQLSITPPVAPENFRYTNTTEDSVLLAWDATDDATGYEIQYKRSDADDTEWTTFTISDGITETATITPLLAGTSFDFQIRSVVETVIGPIYSEWSDTEPATTVAMAIPNNFIRTSETEDSLSLAWDIVGNATGYDIQYKRSTGTTWTTLSVSGGDTDAETIASLLAGAAYDFQIRTVKGSNYSYWSATVSAETFPAVPTDLTSPSQTSSSITLTWFDETGETSFVIQYRKAGDTWIEQSTATNSATIEGLDPITEYEIRVYAVNSAGESDWSDAIFVTTDKIQLTTPVLQVTAVDNHTINVSWEPVEHADGYVVMYSTNTDFEDAQPVETTDTSIELTGLTANATYYIQVTAIGSGIFRDSEPSFGSAATPAIQLNTPTLGEVIATSINKISVSWEKVANASGYEIQYSTDSEFTVGVGSKTVDFETFSTELIVPEPGTVYFVRVVAIGTGEYGNSDPSGEESTTTHLSIPSLDSTDQTTSSITLSWNDVANAIGYEIRYRKAGGAWGEPSTYESPATIEGLDAFTVYEFQVRAVNSVCASEWSDAISVTTLKITLPEPMLGAVTATGSSTINVEWEAVPHASGYIIQYATNSAFAGALTKTVEAGTTSTKLKELISGTTYYVRVMAVGTGIYEDSEYSTARSATTEKVKLSTPKLGEVKITNINKISITWSAVENANGYRIEYATDSEFTTGIGSKTVNAATTSIELTGLDLGTTYYVRVVAVGTGMYGNSDPSKAKSATTEKIKLPTPPAPVSKVNAADSITVTWSTVPGASGYVVQYSTSSAFTGAHTLMVDSTTTSIDLTELAAYTTYYVRVMVTGSGAFINSDYSSAKSSTTHKIKLEAPALGNVVATGSSTINVAWGAMDNASGYTIQYATNASFSGALTKTVNLTNTSTDITGLKANTTYYVRILATGANAYSDSGYSVPKMAKTNEAPVMSTTAVPVKPVVKVTPKATTISSVTLTWKINSENKDYTSANFIITGTALNTSAKIGEVIVTNGKATVIITGLLPKTKYKFSVTATNGQFIQTASVSVTTAKYTAVKSLKSTAKTSNSVTLSWKSSSAKGNTTGYVVEVYNSTGKVRLDTISIAGVNATKFTVSGLKAKTMYTFVVKAVEGTLESSSAKVNVTTKK